MCGCMSGTAAPSWAVCSASYSFVTLLCLLSVSRHYVVAQDFTKPNLVLNTSFPLLGIFFSKLPWLGGLLLALCDWRLNMMRCILLYVSSRWEVDELVCLLWSWNDTLEVESLDHWLVMSAMNSVKPAYSWVKYLSGCGVVGGQEAIRSCKFSDFANRAICYSRYRLHVMWSPSKHMEECSRKLLIHSTWHTSMKRVHQFLCSLSIWQPSILLMASSGPTGKPIYDQQWAHGLVHSAASIAKTNHQLLPGFVQDVSVPLMHQSNQ